MNTEKFSEAMNEIGSRYIEESIEYKRKKSKAPVWAKWGAVAACLAVVAILGICAFANKPDTVTLNNGSQIVFSKSEAAGASSLDIDGTVTTRQLTESETASLFPGLSVTANAIFRSDDASADNNKELIGINGKIGNIKMIISTTDIQLLDTKIVGNEKSSHVNGTSITAGYFLTRRNSVGKQNAIYYATFNLGGSTVYVENSGAKSESQNVKIELADIIQKLTKNGVFDLDSING